MVALGLTVGLAVGASATWAQQVAGVSFSEVLGFVTARTEQGATVEEMVVAALAEGYAPELVADALLGLGLPSVEIALALVKAGVPRAVAAKVVVALAGLPSEEPVKSALLFDAPPEERAAIESAVRDGLAAYTASIGSNSGGDQAGGDIPQVGTTDPSDEPEAALPARSVPTILVPQQNMGGGGTTRN